MTRNESSRYALISLLIPSLLGGLQSGCAHRPPTASQLERLQGTWVGGVVGEKTDAKYTVTISGDSFHFHRDPEFWFRTTFTLPAGTDPQQLLATIRECAPGQENSIGKTVAAIFKIEEGTLILAARGDGGDETPTGFDATEDKGLTRYELRKAPPQGGGARAAK
jgi:uncharacterized protein (TIGR03067 family)